MLGQPKKRGRPSGTGHGRGEGILLRMHPPMLERIDAWIASRPDPRPSRPEAIRQLVHAALGAEAEEAPAQSSARAGDT